jgi:anti-sigma factor ChrR (cupin superfamily)
VTTLAALRLFASARRRDSDWRPFDHPDGTRLGDEVRQLDTNRARGKGFHLYRKPAGMRMRTHRHNGTEQVLVLEGELHESDGKALRAGDLVFCAEGTAHDSDTPGGCLLAVQITAGETVLD